MNGFLFSVALRCILCRLRYAYDLLFDCSVCVGVVSVVFVFEVYIF